MFFLFPGHLCYLRPPAPEGEKGAGRKKSASKQLYFDFEACADHISECQDGYSPPVENLGCPRCRLQGDQKCVDCRRCVNCSRSKCGSFLHTPNLVVGQTSCDICKNSPFDPATSKCSSCGSRCRQCDKQDYEGEFVKAPCKDCGYREVVFEGFNCSEKFTKWLLTRSHKNFVGMYFS
jgi:hypothetical protein